ncbi:MAG: patatin [Bacteroidetes bacterium]|nr:patatin [Bacteroidota bacterium]
MTPYKILSLDGGGSWALLQSMALKQIYKGTKVGTTCREILQQFDIVVSNSGGSLMLAAMIELYDKDIDEVTGLFLNEGIRRQVFSKLKWYEKSGFEHLASLFKIAPQYKTSRKLGALQNILSETGRVSLTELKNIRKDLPDNIIFCGFDYDRNRATFFRTNHASKSQPYTNQHEVTLAQAVHAASNAPIKYFDAPATFLINNVMHQLWDGAVGGNNNPVLIGITEALAIFEHARRDFHKLQVLSIGTANNLLPVKGFTVTDNAEGPRLLKNIQRPTLSNDIEKMATSIISEPPDAANYMAHMFLGGKPDIDAMPAIIRLNPLLQPVYSEAANMWRYPLGLDGEGRIIFDALLNLDMDAIQQKDVDNIKLLGEWWANDLIINQAIRVDSYKLQCNIGHSLFSQGRTEWLKRTGII